MIYKIDYIPVGKRQYPTGRKMAKWILPTLTLFLVLGMLFALTVHYGSTDYFYPVILRSQRPHC